MGDEAAHADGNIIGDPKRAIPVAVIENRTRADEDVPADFDMTREADAGSDLGKIADSAIMSDDAVGVDNTAFAQSGIRTDVGEGTDEGPLAQTGAIADDGARRDDSDEVQMWVVLMEPAPVRVVSDRDDTVPVAEPGRIKVGLAKRLEAMDGGAAIG